MGVSIDIGVSGSPGVSTGSGAPAFNPTSIAGLQLWLDGADASTITQSGGNVSQWNDKSGNNYNAVQASGALQPPYIIAGQNGRNLVRFSTTGQSLVVNPSLVAASIYTVFAVFNSSTNDTGAAHAGFYIQPSLLMYGVWTSAPNWGSFRGTTGPLQSSYSVYNTMRTCCVAQASATDITLYTDGNTPEAFPSTSPPYLLLTSSTIGTDQYGQVFLGDFCEIVYYDRLLSPTEISDVQNYLRTKWGTA